MTIRDLKSLAAVLGELSYLRGWIVMTGPDGVRRGIRELMSLARRDLRKESWAKEVLLARNTWWEDDPLGRTKILRRTPEGDEVLFEEVPP